MDRCVNDTSDRFRSTVDMASHRFSRGQYRYFNRPLPTVVGELRSAVWSHLLPVARQWADRLGQPAPWPDTLDDWLDQCHAAGQSRGWASAPMRHSLSVVRTGRRHALGLIFHDAQ